MAELQKQAELHGLSIAPAIANTYPVDRGSVRVGHIFCTPYGWFALRADSTKCSSIGDSMSALKFLAACA